MKQRLLETVLVKIMFRLLRAFHEKMGEGGQLGSGGIEISLEFERVVRELGGGRGGRVVQGALEQIPILQKMVHFDQANTPV